jgi:hypothetical protein
MAITIAQIIDAVESTLSAATGIVRGQSYNELTESVDDADTPLLQVYPEANSPQAIGGTTVPADRSSFGGGTDKPVRVKNYTIHVDLYAQQRKEIGEDMAALVDGIDAIEDVLENQDQKNYFGLDGIKSFSWSWTRVTFVYGDPQLSYVGARFLLMIAVY